MENQLSILDVIENDGDDSIQARFERFHKANPQVFREFEKLSLKAIGKGKRKIGGRMIIEVIRWNIWMNTDPDEKGYKINNDFISRYVRLFIERYPHYRDRFELRAIKS